MSELDRRYSLLETMLEITHPGLVDSLKSGHKVYLMRKEVDDSELATLGAIVKVAIRYGITVMIGPFDHIAMFDCAESKSSGGFSKESR